MTTYQIAQKAISTLYAGQPPNGIGPDDLGEWGSFYAELCRAWKDGGTDGVRRAFDAVARADRRLYALVSGEAPHTDQVAQLGPELPPAAQAVYAHLAPCGFWLQEYIAFASEAAPMTPRNFHEATGLFAVSMAVARRLYCVSGMHRLYPNLYFLYVSPSTIDHKSTGLYVLQSIIRDAGLGHLLMPRKATPQALVADLDYGKLPTPRQLQDRDFYLARRAFAAQRGWLRDEASALFASLKQEFNAGLLELILELYDCPDEYDDLTISRNETRIERAYLSFFGVSTPVEMAPHFANLNYWTNGLWARCLVLTPDERARVFQFFPKTIQGNGHIISHLQHIYRLFPVPSAELEIINNDDLGRNNETVVRLRNIAAPQQIILAPGVWEAWEAYAQATGHTFLIDRMVEEELFACYGRLGDLSMKVAMLLATMDADQLPITVTLAHYAAAQQRVETWRVGLHRLWSSQSATTETRLMDRILKKLERAAQTGMTVRDLCISLRQNARETNDSLALLAKAGKVTSTTITAGNGRSVEVWRCAERSVA